MKGHITFQSQWGLNTTRGTIRPDLGWHQYHSSHLRSRIHSSRRVETSRAARSRKGQVSGRKGWADQASQHYQRRRRHQSCWIVGQCHWKRRRRFDWATKNRNCRRNRKGFVSIAERCLPTTRTKHIVGIASIRSLKRTLWISYSSHWISRSYYNKDFIFFV